MQVSADKQPAVMSDNQAADLMSFCASEFQQFFSHLGNSIYTYKNTGKVPSSAFKGSGHNAGTAKSDKPKTKRKPTAFNMFVKEKMEELKSSGVTLDGDKNNNGMFTLAVSSWKNLSDQAKADYTNKFKVNILHYCLYSVPVGAPCYYIAVRRNASSLVD